MKLPKLNRLPATPDEMVAMLLEAGRARAYVDITTAARRKRLTEHDIAVIERNILGLTVVTPEIADEFKSFEAEPAFAQARSLLKQYFEIARKGRATEIEKQ